MTTIVDIKRETNMLRRMQGFIGSNRTNEFIQGADQQAIAPVQPVNHDNMAKTLAESKFKLIKEFIGKHKDKLPEKMLNEITLATNIGDLWSVIFFYQNNLFFVLKNAGIYPTKAELSEINPSTNVNAWFWLVRSITCQPIFASLFIVNIFPDSIDLSMWHNGTDDNAWSYLSLNEEGHAVFSGLIERGILPPQIIMNHRFLNAYPWYYLACTSEGRKILIKLISKGIRPDADLLNEWIVDHDDNFWLKLSSDSNTFIDLLNLNILPTRAALAACRKLDNRNVWLTTAGNGEYILLIRTLIGLNILPSSEDLDIPSLPDGWSTWSWMTGRDELAQLMNDLIDMNIIPGKLSLNRINKNDNTSSWFWLSAGVARHKLMYRLINMGILPSAEHLNFYLEKFNVTSWHKILESCDDHLLVTLLLSQNIYPSARALNHGAEGKDNGWNLLTLCGHRIAIFEQLINLCILPKIDGMFGSQLDHSVLRIDVLPLLQKMEVMRETFLLCLQILAGKRQKESVVSSLSHDTANHIISNLYPGNDKTGQGKLRFSKCLNRFFQDHLQKKSNQHIPVLPSLGSKASDHDKEETKKSARGL